MPLSILPTTNFDFSRLSNPLNNPNNVIPPQPNDRIITPDIYNNIRQVLLNPPQASQFGSRRNTILAAIGGGAAGFASRDPNKGIEAADYIKNIRYRQAYQDWLAKSGALEKGVALDTGLERAKNSGINSLASMLRATTASDPVLQGEIAGAKSDNTKTTNQKEFKFSESLPEDEKKAFDTYVDKKRSAIERNTSLHLSVKDAREQNIPLVDRDGKPIDTSKLPDNMEYRMFLGGPNGPYFAPDTQMTRDVTQDNQRRTIPVLTPTEPITEGQAITPIIREDKGVDAQGNPVAQELQTRRVTNSTPGVISPQNNPHLQNNQLPVVQPPIQQNQNLPIQQNNQPVVVPKSQTQIIPPQQPNNNNQKPGIRPLGAFDASTVEKYKKYTVPASGAFSQLLGSSNDPNSEPITKFAYLMDDKEAKAKMGVAIRLIANSMLNSGESNDNIGISLAGYGAHADTGGIWNWIKNSTGITAKMEASKAKLIDDAMANLKPDEQRFVDKLFATWGSLAGFRSVIGQSGYEWANKQMRTEISTPGISGSASPKEFINKIANFAGEMNEGIRNAKIPLSIFPEQVEIDKKTKELTKMGLGLSPIPSKQRRTSFEVVQ